MFIRTFASITLVAVLIAVGWVTAQQPSTSAIQAAQEKQDQWVLETHRQMREKGIQTDDL